MFGGLLYLLGAFVMAYNLYMTVKGKVREEKPLVSTVAAQPAE